MFNVEKFLETLPTMALGMVGIFIVIFAIAIAIRILYWLFPVEGSGKISKLFSKKKVSQ